MSNSETIILGGVALFDIVMIYWYLCMQLEERIQRRKEITTRKLTKYDRNVVKVLEARMKACSKEASALRDEKRYELSIRKASEAAALKDAVLFLTDKQYLVDIAKIYEIEIEK